MSAIIEHPVQEGTILATLNIQGPGNQKRMWSLREGEEVLIGSDDNADLPLMDSDVSSMHCICGGRKGSVVVRDCYSATGTFVNGRRISEMQLTDDVVVQIGSCTLTIALSDRPTDAAESTTPHSTSGSHAPAPCHHPDAGTAMNAALGSAGRWPLSDEHETPADCPPVARPQHEVRSENARPDRTVDNLQFQLSEAHAELEVLRERLRFSMQDNAESELAFRDEMIGLLQAEVLDLQTALAAQSATPGGPQLAADEADVLTREEAEKLVTRLEQLLEELTERDEQVTLLTSLLESAEEANRAELDERRQLNEWVSGIEERIGLREQEWQAERQKLLQAIQTLQEERNRAEKAAVADTASARMEAIQKVVNSVRDENESLRSQLSELEATCEQLRRDQQQQQQQQQVPQTDFREEAIRISQERAELARMKHELEVSRSVTGRITESSESTMRFVALRQHLQELHEQEKKQKEEAKLGGRIARLWKLLDRKS